MNRSVFTQVPKKSGVYALCAGIGKNKYIAYVGMAKNLRQRLLQHLVRRSSSIVTGVSAVSLNPDKITEVRWWLLPPEYSNYLHEAEIVAFDVLNPVLRSRAPVSAPVHFIAKRRDFNLKLKKVLNGKPSGSVTIVSYQELVTVVLELESVVKEIKKKK